MMLMKKNYKIALVTLIGGAGVLPILMWIFLGTVDFSLAIIIAFGFFLLSGTLNGLLVETPGRLGPFIFQRSQKQAITSLIAGFGVIAILLGIFNSSVDFGLGIIIAYSFFLIAGAVSQLIEVQEYSTSPPSYSFQDRQELGRDETKVVKKASYVCHSCGSIVGKEDIFCASCGAEQSNY